jgi:cytidine deaminase
MEPTWNQLEPKWNQLKKTGKKYMNVNIVNSNFVETVASEDTRIVDVISENNSKTKVYLK